MKKELHHFILYAAIIFLTGGALLNPVVAALQPLGRNGTHSCGVIDCPRNMQYLDQLPNRHYAQSFPANFSSGNPHIVRLIYFVPVDRTPQRGIDAKIDRLIKDAQQSFAEVMENHGFGRKTFQFEMDASGKAIVHHMTGRFQDAHYGAQPYEEVWDIVWQEVSDTFKQFDPTTNVYFAVMDIGSESFNINGGIPNFILCGLGGHYGSFGGRALMPASGDCFSTDIATHELGHAFGLLHDRFKNTDRRPSSYHADLMTSSFCAAEWLDVHRYFNIGKTYPSGDNLTVIRLSPPVASSANTIHLRFEITDGDGLQQAQLYWIEDVIACQSLNGQSDVYEFELIPALHRVSDFIVLRVMDIDGNFIEELYPIDITALLPAPRAVSIPDTNLATAIRQELELAPSDTFTQWNLAQLVFLDAASRGIRNLHGLEHATRLSTLSLPNNSVSDIGVLAGMTSLTRLNLGPEFVGGQWVNSNSVSDISALTSLTGLIKVDLAYNSISDISSLAGLTNMEVLYLGGNSISDISPLAGLTYLRELDLEENSISDISVLAGLTHLTNLWLWDNSISDISPLVTNTGLGSGDTVYLQYNPLSYQSIHTHIPALQSRGVTVQFDSQLEIDPDKIAGPWLWMIAPTAPGRGGARSNNVDSLAAASDGTVTEAAVAANGAKEGAAVGNYVWTLGRISETGGNNINDLINAIGLAQGDVNHHSSYALITLESITTQSNVTMRVGSDDSIKVWLNGEVVHNNPMNRGATDFQDRFTVNLKQGDNLLLVKVSERRGGWSMFVGIEADVNAVYKRASDPVVSADVNRDGIVNILDLVVIASQFGSAGQNLVVDVNGDGVVNILDLILVAGTFDDAAAAPSASSQASETLTPADVRGWLTAARTLDVRDPIMRRGIMVLEQLLISLTPTKTQLLPNYPNPFNPETWIPYRLAEDAFVTLTIYDRSGQVVRRIDVGHQSAAAYESRSKAVYWDGRNEFGEAVASGVYFYHLSAGDYSATRKMVVLK